MGIDWIATPDQRRQRYIDALRALRRPCDCPDRCAVQERWWFAIDGVLDAWLESERLMGADRG